MEAQKKIAVTGGAGFIGSAVVRALNDRGETDILVVDRLGSGGKFKNLRAKSFRGIASPAEFLHAVESDAVRLDVIVHMGARTDTGESDADLMLEHNTLYTRRLAVLAQERGIRLIFASSASVYGDGAAGFSDDDALTMRLQPLNAYAYSKWLADAFALRDGWARVHAGLRFFNVFGPNEYHKGRMASVAWHAYRQVQETGRIALFRSHKEGVADGAQARDFIYVKDVARVILWFIDRPDAAGVYNLGSGRARTFNDLATAIFAAMGREPSIEYVPTPDAYRAGYQYFTEADLSKLRAAGCDIPFASLEQTVTDYVTGYLARGERYW